MKVVHRLISNLRCRLFLWVPCLMFCGWSLCYLVGEWQVERQRALYGGRSIHEWINEALAEDYYSARWATFEERAGSVAENRVISIGAPAVPELVKRLRKLRVVLLRQDKLAVLRLQLVPSWQSYPRFLEVPNDVSGDAAHINYLLSRMGNAARPAVPEMLNSTVVLHAWAYSDLLADFVTMGTAARDAVPRLKGWAGAGDEGAALAVKLIEQGRTELGSYDLDAVP